MFTSVSNPKVKGAIHLKESRIRRRENKFLVDGVREVFRAWQSGWHFIEIFVQAESDEGMVGNPEARHYEELNKFVQELYQEKIPVWRVSPQVFEKIGFGDRNEGIVAVVEGQTLSLADLEYKLPEAPLIGVLEGIEKPGNIGAVFRSADGAGLDAMILVDSGSDLYNPNTIRASLGTLFRIPTVVTTAEEAFHWLIRSKIQIAAALCGVSVPYTFTDYTQGTAIVLGNEADGLTPIWTKPVESEPGIMGIKIPMLGIADSLNISNAAAILFYEARRQRQEKFYR